MKRFAIAAACLLLAGCGTSKPIADELTEFNKAQQQGTAQLVLLNVLRAREGQPLAYSHFDVLRGGVNASSSLGFNLPFGPGATGLDPRIISGGMGVSPGVSQDVKPQDDQQFYRGILTPLTQETWALYQDQNWPSDMLFHLFVEDIKLSPSDFDAIMGSTARVCNDHADVQGTAAECAALAESDDAVAHLAGCAPLKLLSGGDVKVEVYNDPRDRCHLLRFEAFTRALTILGFRVAQHKSETDVGPSLGAGAFGDAGKWPFALKDADVTIAKSPDGRYQFREVSKDYGVELSNLPCPNSANVALAATSEIGAQIRTQAKAVANTKGGECEQHRQLQIAITTRSPDGMLYYLGEVARAELPLDNTPPLTVSVRNEGGDPRALMRVVAADDPDPAVKVTYNGTTYSVPRGEDHVTMQAIELVEQIYALYNQASIAPSTTAVTVVP